jgi:hypothetical protein
LEISEEYQKTGILFGIIQTSYKIFNNQYTLNICAKHTPHLLGIMKLSKTQTFRILVVSSTWIGGLVLLFSMESFSLKDSCGIRKALILHAIASLACLCCLAIWACVNMILYVKYEQRCTKSSSAILVFGVMFGNLTSTGLLCLGLLYFEVLSECDRLTKEHYNGPIFHCFFVIFVTLIVFFLLLVKDAIPHSRIIQDVEQPLTGL